MSLLEYYNPDLNIFGFDDHVSGGRMYATDHAYIYPAFYGNWGNVFTPESIKENDAALADSKSSIEISNAILPSPVTTGKKYGYNSTNNKQH